MRLLATFISSLILICGLPACGSEEKAPSLVGEWALVERSGGWSDGTSSIEESPSTVSIGSDSSFYFEYRDMDTEPFRLRATYRASVLRTTEDGDLYAIEFDDVRPSDADAQWTHAALEGDRLALSTPGTADAGTFTYVRL